MININDINVKFKFTDGTGDLIAIVTIEDEQLSIRGFLLMKSKYEGRREDFLRVSPPTYGEKHHLVVYFPDKSLWYQIEDRIVEAYKEQKSTPNSAITKEDEEWVDETLKEK